jgi:hypothetical protein
MAVNVLIVLGIIIIMMLVVAAVVYYTTRNKTPRKQEPAQFETYSINSHPAVLWILPICYGMIGGTIAALFAGIKYNAVWWKLFLVGIIIQLAVILAGIFLFGRVTTGLFSL